MWKKFKDVFHDNFAKVYVSSVSLLAILLKLYDQIGLLWLICSLVILIPIPFIRRFIQKKSDEVSPAGVFGDHAFMIDFIKQFLDKANSGFDFSHKMSRVKREININGRDLQQIRIYEGKFVKDGLSYGFPIQTIGGACIDTNEIDISCYDLSEKERLKSDYSVLYDGERLKVIFLKFKNQKSNGEKFSMEFREENWFGAMRNNYDGIFLMNIIFLKLGLKRLRLIYDH